MSGDADDIDAEFEDIVSHFASSAPDPDGPSASSGPPRNGGVDRADPRGERREATDAQEEGHTGVPGPQDPTTPLPDTVLPGPGVSGLGASEPSAPEPPTSAGAAPDTPTPGEPDPDAPVDESLHLDGGHLCVALVLAPLPSPGALHSLLALAGLKEAVVRLRPWTAVWLRVETAPSPEDELASLAGGGREMPGPVDEVARVVSRLSKFGAVAIMSWLVEGEGIEPGVSGQITARRYVQGQPEEDIPAGVLLGSMPPATEDLLLGRTTPCDYEDSVAPDGTAQRKAGPFGWFRRK